LLVDSIAFDSFNTPGESDGAGQGCHAQSLKLTRVEHICMTSETGTAALWTGRIDVDLLNGRGWQVGSVEFVVRIESITVWLQNRTLAVMDRDLFRSWLNRPLSPFDIDDLLWSVEDDVTCLMIDRSHQYLIPEPVARQLTLVI
jgi:hypothetical protein